jgi:LacI family transcriptional regulator
MVDVAEAAGVSRTTASFVLNGREAGIPAETSQRVMRAAHRLGYHRNASALALATGRTNRFGVVLNDPERFLTRDTYCLNVLAGITAGALSHDRNLVLHSSHYPDWKSLYADILGGGADGTLLVGRSGDDELTHALLEARYPVVCVSYHVDHPRCLSVDCDNEAGAALAVQHLVELGHRRIVMCSGDYRNSWMLERLRGAQRAVQEAGLAPESLVQRDWGPGGWPTVEGMQNLAQFLVGADPRPTAAIIGDEATALLLVEYLPECGIQVPDDLAVVSFNSTEMSVRSRPPMTSVWQPLQEIAAAAVDMLVRHIDGEEPHEKIRRFPARLDIRESSGAVEQKV